MEISVDKAKLAQGLEDGFCGNESSKFKDTLLRLPFCGVMSTAVKIYLDQKGLDSELVSCSQTGSDSRFMQDEHVFVAIKNESSENPTIVDPTYSQFLNDAGLGIEYQSFTRDEIYPKDKVEVFSLQDRQLVAGKMADCAIRFRECDKPSILDDTRPIDGMADLSKEQIAEQFASIWNPDNFHPFSPDQLTYQKASKIAEHIPTDAII